MTISEPARMEILGLIDRLLDQEPSDDTIPYDQGTPAHTAFINGGRERLLELKQHVLPRAHDGEENPSTHPYLKNED